MSVVRENKLLKGQSNNLHRSPIIINCAFISLKIIKNRINQWPAKFLQLSQLLFILFFYIWENVEYYDTKLGLCESMKTNKRHGGWCRAWGICTVFQALVRGRSRSDHWSAQVGTDNAFWKKRIRWRAYWDRKLTRFSSC